MVQERKQSFWAPLIIPFFVVLAMWAIFLIGLDSDTNFSKYGLYPRTVDGLLGILTIPFLHGSWSHLLNNTVPMLVLGWALYKFYPTIASKTFLWIYLISGIWLWISGRANYHIGASGVAYGLAAFLFLSGWLRREKQVAALSLLVAFLYGGLWWGVLPIERGVSWEGHLWGAIAGFALAVAFRKQGPQRTVYQWELDEEQEEDGDNDNEKAGENDFEKQNRPPASNVHIAYSYKPSAEKNGSGDD